MRAVRLALFLGLFLALLMTGGLRGAGVVSATTGNSDTTPVPARFKVPHKIEVLYEGAYVLQSAAAGSRLVHGQMAIEINNSGFLQAIGSFLTYDPQGHQTERVISFYNFHLIAPNTMTVELFGPLGTPLLGTMTLLRTARGDLVGKIALPKTAYAVAFRRNVAL
jgi:hypothetical protein